MFDKYSIHLLEYVSDVNMLFSHFPTCTILNTLQDWIPQIPFRLSFLIYSVSPRISILVIFLRKKVFCYKTDIYIYIYKLYWEETFKCSYDVDLKWMIFYVLLVYIHFTLMSSAWFDVWGACYNWYSSMLRQQFW